MTRQDYLDRIRDAETNAEAFAVTRDAIKAANEGRLTVDDWNAIWIAYDKLIQPQRYEKPIRTFD